MSLSNIIEKLHELQRAMAEEHVELTKISVHDVRPLRIASFTEGMQSVYDHHRNRNVIAIGGVEVDEHRRRQ